MKDRVRLEHTDCFYWRHSLDEQRKAIEEVAFEVFISAAVLCDAFFFHFDFFFTCRPISFAKFLYTSPVCLLEMVRVVSGVLHCVILESVAVPLKSIVCSDWSALKSDDYLRGLRVWCVLDQRFTCGAWAICGLWVSPASILDLSSLGHPD